MKAADRLFIGTFPTGISYADKQRERDGDYRRIAFLPFSTLILEWSPGRHPPELRELIERDAKHFRSLSAGQTIMTGRQHHAAKKKSSAQLDHEIANIMARAPGHRFRTVTKGKLHRYECECNKRGSWVRSDDRAADSGDRHHRNAVRA